MPESSSDDNANLPPAENLSGNVVRFRGNGAWHNPCDKAINARSEGAWVLIEEGHKIYDETTDAWYVISCNDQVVNNAIYFVLQQTSGAARISSQSILTFFTAKAETREFEVRCTGKVVSTGGDVSLALYDIYLNGNKFTNPSTGSLKTNVSTENLTFDGTNNEQLNDVCTIESYSESFTNQGGSDDFPDYNIKVDFTIKVTYKNRVLFTDSWRVVLEGSNNTGSQTITR